MVNYIIELWIVGNLLIVDCHGRSMGYRLLSCSLHDFNYFTFIKGPDGDVVISWGLLIKTSLQLPQIKSSERIVGRPLVAEFVRRSYHGSGTRRVLGEKWCVLLHLVRKELFDDFTCKVKSLDERRFIYVNLSCVLNCLLNKQIATKIATFSLRASQLNLRRVQQVWRFMM